MILAMIVMYCFLLYLLFDVFKVVKSTTRNRIYVTIIGIFGIICVLFFINWYQPMSTDLRVMRYVVPIAPSVSGRVVEVAVTMDTPIKEGDILFRIDPEPYRAEVARLEAAVADAEQRAKMLPVELQAARTAVARSRAKLVDARQQAEALTAKLERTKSTVDRLDAQLTLASSVYERDLEIQRRNPNAISQQDLDSQLASVKAAQAALAEGKMLQTQAQLEYDAKIDGTNTIVVIAQEALRAAEANEIMARLALESDIDGVNTVVAQARAQLENAKLNLSKTEVRAPADGFLPDIALRPGQYLPASGAPVLSFVNQSEYAIVASFPQVVLRNIAVDDPVEIALDDYPGYTFGGKVKTISWAVKQGQVIPSGQIVDAKPVPHGRFFVELTIDNPDELRLPPGEAGAATIYTQYGKAFVPVRKVFFRWYTWINFVIPDMDIRGQRD